MSVTPRTMLEAQSTLVRSALCVARHRITTVTIATRDFVNGMERMTTAYVVAVLKSIRRGIAVLMNLNRTTPPPTCWEPNPTNSPSIPSSKCHRTYRTIQRISGLPRTLKQFQAMCAA